MSVPSGTKSLWDDVAANQTFILVAILVGVHLLLIVAVVGCLWKQTPKKAQLNRAFIDDQREEFKRTIRKAD
jgi:uncharacterized membrane protein YqjE